MTKRWARLRCQCLAQALLGGLHRIPAVWVLVLVSVFACGAGWSESPSLGSFATAFRWMVPLLATGTLLVLVSISPAIGLPVFAAIIPFLGFVRREMIPLVGYSGSDPITLFTGFVVAILVARLLISRSIRVDTLPTKLMIPLLVVMAIQVLNPAQGGLVVGIAGAIFYFVPILYFFVGRCYGNVRVLERVLTAILLAGIVCAIYGLYQNAFGFNEREWAWVASAKYRQQMLGIYRVFSTFLSFGEYVMFIGMAGMVAWTRLLRRQWIYAPAVVLFGITIFLSSSRSGVISYILASVVSWAVLSGNRRGWWLRGAIAAVVAVFGLVNTLNGIRDAESEDRNAVLLGHQASGLTNPLGEESTGRLHLGLVAFGFRSGLVRPAGIGLGATTVAAEKFGENSDVSTELDITNFMVSTGLIGGVLYMALVSVLFKRLFSYWLRARNGVALSVIGVATMLLGNWTTGGYYAPSALIWLMLGAVDFCLSSLEKEREASSVKALSNRPVVAAPEFATTARG